jgi:hypothetical protein
MTEKELLDWLVENVDHTIKKAEYKYSSFDAYSELHDCFIELKCRRTHYDSLLIEKKKFDSLTEDGEALYICSTPKGVWCWTLQKDMAIEWDTKSMPRNTDFGNRSHKPKEVSYLRIEDAKRLK